MSTPSSPDPDDRTTRPDDVGATADDGTAAGSTPTGHPAADAGAPTERDAPGPTPPPPSWASSSADQPVSSADPLTAPAGAPERTSALGPATGQHAAARPYPPSTPTRADDALTAPLATDRPVERPAEPSASQTAVLPPTTTSAPTPTHADGSAPAGSAPAGAAGTAAGTAAAAAAVTRDRRDLRDEPRAVHQDLPERPRKPGVGRHLLGTLLGLLLTPVALLLVGIGTARLNDVAGSGDPATDALGLTLLILGTLLLAVIVLLGSWSPAVPIVGGVVWGIGLGVAYLAVPGLMADTVESMVGERVLPAAVEQLTESAVSGQLLVTGTLLLAAGITAARARRNGRRWAEAVAAADLARADVARRDAERAAAAR